MFLSFFLFFLGGGSSSILVPRMALQVCGMCFSLKASMGLPLGLLGLLGKLEGKRAPSLGGPLGKPKSLSPRSFCQSRALLVVPPSAGAALTGPNQVLNRMQAPSFAGFIATAPHWSCGSCSLKGPRDPRHRNTEGSTCHVHPKPSSSRESITESMGNPAKNGVPRQS